MSSNRVFISSAANPTLSTGRLLVSSDGQLNVGGELWFTTGGSDAQINYQGQRYAQRFLYADVQTPFAPSSRELRFVGDSLYGPRSHQLLILNNFQTGQSTSDPDFQFRYVGYAFSYENIPTPTVTNTFEAFVYGFDTRFDDLPTVGRTWAVTARAEVGQDGTRPLGGSGMIEYNPGTRTFQLLINLTEGSGPATTTFDTISGACQSNQSSFGAPNCTLTSSSGRYSVTVAGQMFGPQGAEIGLVFVLRGIVAQTVPLVQGVVIGR